LVSDLLKEALQMKVVEILIHDYKSCCSEVKECRLKLDEKVTFLIGANESGKTNILEAMSKFSVGKFQDVDIPHKSVCSRSPQIPDDLKMVSVTLAVEDNDQPVLKRIDPALAKAKRVTVTRNYTGEPYIESLDIDLEPEAGEFVPRLQQSSRDFASRFSKYIKQYKAANKAAASPTRSVLARSRGVIQRIEALCQSLEYSKKAPTRRAVKRLREGLLALANPLESLESDILAPLDEIDSMLKKLPKHLDIIKASPKLWALVPRFVFIPADPQLWLSGEYLVDDILHKESGVEELESVRRLLSLADFNLENTCKLRDEMQIEALEVASAKATEILKEVWSQGQHIRIELGWSPAEGNTKLQIRIKSAGHRGSPEYRSLGFRWFLEFYLIYATALRRNVVLVFEEPGIHLHPDAQDDLKGIIRDKVAEQCQVVYTTHLPGMYDLAYPEGCRAVMIDSKTGVTTIESQYSPNHQYTTWEVAMRALGITSPMLRMCNRNIIVEGPADWIYLLTFAQLLASEEPSLSGVASGLIHIHPCHGANSIPGIVPFFFQRGVKSVVLLDSDQPGKNAKDKLESQFHPPSDHITGILMINDVDYADSGLAAKELELEDLLGINLYASLVTETLGQNRKITDKEFKKKNRIGAEAARLVREKYGIKLEHDEVAWCLRESVQHEDREIPEKVKASFKKLLLKATEMLDVATCVK